MKNRKLEVCVDSLVSALSAEKGGADRIELCHNLVEGGTTPSAGLIKQVSEAIDIDIRVMIRPRGGDFLYSRDEIEVMKEDIKMVKTFGVDGIVLGCLKSDGKINKELCAELLSLAKPLKVTFHRAFDMLQDPLQSLEELIQLGFDRVLTSGLQPDVIAGIGTLKDLVSLSKDRIKIMAGGGVRDHNLKQLLNETGVREVHVSARKTIESKMTFQRQEIEMGAIPQVEYIQKVVDEEQVKAYRKILNAAN